MEEELLKKLDEFNYKALRPYQGLNKKAKLRAKRMADIWDHRLEVKVHDVKKWYFNQFGDHIQPMCGWDNLKKPKLPKED